MLVRARPGNRPMYNCKKCPGYCCSYPLIALDQARRGAAGQAFRPELQGRPRPSSRSSAGATSIPCAARRTSIFGRVCRFFDTEKRCCTVYEARPVACRSYPGRALRLLRLPVVRARARRRTRVHRHHHQQVTVGALQAGCRQRWQATRGSHKRKPRCGCARAGPSISADSCPAACAGLICEDRASLEFSDLWDRLGRVLVISFARAGTPNRALALRRGPR